MSEKTCLPLIPWLMFCCGDGTFEKGKNTFRPPLPRSNIFSSWLWRNACFQQFPASVWRLMKNGELFQGGRITASKHAPESISWTWTFKRALALEVAFRAESIRKDKVRDYCAFVVYVSFVQLLSKVVLQIRRIRKNWPTSISQIPGKGIVQSFRGRMRA